jgi:hypothetical protein
MINRLIFRGQLKSGKEEAGISSMLDKLPLIKSISEAGRIMTAAAYRWQKNVFLYYECINCEIHPEELLGQTCIFLEDWPGKPEKRKWIPMTDVFHFNEPVCVEHWKRKSPVEKRIGKVAQLKPEMTASYIYYHYQLQEERAFSGDKYEIIALHENLLFGYFEKPEVMEEPLVPKKLNTSGTPVNWGDSRMDLHFIPWEDGTIFFKEIGQIFEIY